MLKIIVLSLCGLSILAFIANYEVSQSNKSESVRQVSNDQCQQSDIIVKYYNELSKEFELDSEFSMRDFCERKESLYAEATHIIKDLLKAGVAVELSLDCYPEGERLNEVISGYRKECRDSDSYCRELFRFSDNEWIQAEELYDSICST